MTGGAFQVSNSSINKIMVLKSTRVMECLPTSKTSIKLSGLGINKKPTVAPENQLYVKLKAFLKGDSFFHFCVTLSLKLSVTLLPPSLPLLDSDPPIS